MQFAAGRRKLPRASLTLCDRQTLHGVGGLIQGDVLRRVAAAISLTYRWQRRLPPTFNPSSVYVRAAYDGRRLSGAPIDSRECVPTFFTAICVFICRLASPLNGLGTVAFGGKIINQLYFFIFYFFWVNMLESNWFGHSGDSQTFIFCNF